MPTTTEASADKEKPTAPSSLGGYLVYNYNNFRYDLRLTWKASTDNKGVSKYIVKKDGNVIGSTGNTYITDNWFSPGPTGVYSITAFDTAGNESDAASIKLRATCTLIWCSLQ